MLVKGAPDVPVPDGANPSAGGADRILDISICGWHIAVQNSRRYLVVSHCASSVKANGNWTPRGLFISRKHAQSQLLRTYRLRQIVPLRHLEIALAKWRFTHKAAVFTWRHCRQADRQCLPAFCSKVNILQLLNVNCARATAFISDSRMDVLVKVSKFFKTEDVSTWGGLEPSTFGSMPSTLVIWAIRARRLLSHVYGYWLWWYIYIYIYIYICIYISVDTQQAGQCLLILLYAGTILCMGSTNKIRRYNITSSLISWAYTQNDPWYVKITRWGLYKMASILQTTFPNALFLKIHIWFFINLSLKFVPRSPINNKSAHMILACRWTVDKQSWWRH